MARLRNLLIPAAVVAGVAAAPAVAQDGAPVAQSVRVSESPLAVRVAIDFAGGRALSAREGELQALDAAPGDGRAIVEVARAGRRAGIGVTEARGVRVRLVRRGPHLAVVARAARNRFPFVSYSTTAAGRRVVVSLWKATTARAATRLDDGCLRLARWNGGRGRATARGLELRPLFEHSLVLTVRTAANRVLGLRAVTASEGIFRPDFSGYAVPGRWHGAVPYAVGAPRRAMLQAWSTSARDGALECLVQVPVLVRPAP